MKFLLPALLKAAVLFPESMMTYYVWDDAFSSTSSERLLQSLDDGQRKATCAWLMFVNARDEDGDLQGPAGRLMRRL